MKWTTLGCRGSCKESRFLIQVTSGVFWRRHVDHLHSAVGSPVEPRSHTVPLSPDLSDTDQTDYPSCSDTETPEQLQYLSLHQGNL